jgi:hypothetical protein
LLFSMLSEDDRYSGDALAFSAAAFPLPN